MISPENLIYDVYVSDLTVDEMRCFAGKILEICRDDVIVDFEGKRVLVHASDLQKSYVI